MWRDEASSGLPAPDVLWDSGHVNSSWLSGSRALPAPNVPNLGTLAILKSLGPMYRFGSGP